MVERIVVNKITAGDGDDRVEYAPGSVIDTDDFDMDEEDVARLDEQRVFRPRVDPVALTSAREPQEEAPRRRGRPRRDDNSDEL